MPHNRVFFRGMAFGILGKKTWNQWFQVFLTLVSNRVFLLPSVSGSL